MNLFSKLLHEDFSHRGHGGTMEAIETKFDKLSALCASIANSEVK